jgi:hypothetical protein
MRRENKLYSEKNQPMLMWSREKHIIKNITSKLNVKKSKVRVPVGTDNFECSVQRQNF